MADFTTLLVGAFNSISFEALQEIIVASNTFAISVYKDFLKKDSEANFVISPFSVEIVLALVFSGAKGQTAEEIAHALRLHSNKKQIEDKFNTLLSVLKCTKTGSLKFVNKVYIKNTFSVKAVFHKTAKEMYKSAIEAIDFAPEEIASEIINQWVDEVTENGIRNLVQPEDFAEQPKMVLVNALYFQCNFQNKFPRVERRDFYKSYRNIMTVDVMVNVDVYNYYEHAPLNTTFLEIPFADGTTALIIALPNSKEGLYSLEEEDISKVLIVEPHFTFQLVEVVVPTFKFETSLDFVDILKNLGVNRAFQEEKADFSNISDNSSGLCVSNILQKAVIDLNQNGVQAGETAYEDVGMPLCGFVSDVTKTFVADHPFIFYIKVNNVVLFVGKVVDPTLCP